MKNMNINAFKAIELLQKEVNSGNDCDLRMKMCFSAGGEPAAAEVCVDKTPLFDLPVEIEPPLPESTPPTAPNAEVEEVKSNILGWLNLALKETARLNVEGRRSMCDLVMTEVQNVMKTVRRYAC